MQNEEYEYEYKPLESQRYLDTNNEDVFTLGYLQITDEMSSQLWDKISALIESQVKFCKPKKQLPEDMEEEKPFISQVKLLADANVYISDRNRLRRNAVYGREISFRH